MGENGLMMRCAKCGEPNKLPAVHCKRCGAKLDFEAAERNLLRSGRGFSAGGCRNGVRLALIVALLGVLLLLVWPGQMPRTTGEELDAKRYRMNCELMIDAMNRGEPDILRTIAEKEINAHLAEVVAGQPAAQGGMAPVVKDLAARFTAGQAEVFIAVRRGPFTLTGQFQARPEGSTLAVVGARAGHLPLPGALGRLYAQTVRGVFRQMGNESRILRNLESVQVRDGEIELKVRSGD